jgi:uncharacterized protein
MTVSHLVEAEAVKDEGRGRRSGTSARWTVGQRVALGVLRGYQIARAGRVSPCRFYPSCSAYGVEAVERHGARRGLWLAARRLARCHPLGGHGVDLVPLEAGRPRRGRG